MKKEHQITKRLFRSKTIKKMDHKIKLLGENAKFQTSTFLGIRLLGSVILFLGSLFFLKNGYLIAPLLVVTFYLGSEYVLLDIPIQKRGKKLEHEAIFFFEILALTLEGGKNLNAALHLTAQNIDSDLSKEFRMALKETHCGKSFTECMNDLKAKIPSDAINNTLLNITQSSVFGNNIIESLNNQLDFLREKQLLEVKEEIAKLPTKISVISVIFFIPLMLLVILAPVILAFIFR
jgi:tight adherence protein C